MARLLLLASSPRLVGHHGTLHVGPATPEEIGAILRTRTADIVSQLTFQSTCDALASLAGLRGVHRHRPDRDSIDLNLANGDQVVIVALRDKSKAKMESLIADDFDFTLCEWQEHRDDSTDNH